MSMDAKLTTNPLSDQNTGFRRDILVMIDRLGGEPSGMEILDALQMTGYPDATHGRLYPNLDDLVEDGLVEKGEIDRRTNYYVLTPSGEQDLDGYREFVGE
ncbi:helix-turn-helix transcriptional regulator [Natrialba taiwanensis]|uniref:Transcriptional regulator PadR family protein n=1 Tax=Natrialba taiwanensis DSM 12281 TaxID=1230458 RepID=L9ZZD8_9EURY|nr:helix-turn-helix transcriptional regulator [Natrialba taiwanensis]ELY91436.1 transcriptional regulator PadR family protein [Natrialba taiwanensis DSM 12281]